MLYIVERVGTKTDFGGTRINLNPSKAFYKVNHHYLKAVLKAAGFGLVFRSCIAAMHSCTYSVVNVNIQLSELGPSRLSTVISFVSRATAADVGTIEGHPF